MSTSSLIRTLAHQRIHFLGQCLVLSKACHLDRGLPVQRMKIATLVILTSESLIRSVLEQLRGLKTGRFPI